MKRKSAILRRIKLYACKNQGRYQHFNSQTPGTSKTAAVAKKLQAWVENLYHIYHYIWKEKNVCAMTSERPP